MEKRLAQLELFADDTRLRLVRIEAKLDDTATKAEFAEVKAKLEHTATKSELADAKTKIILWVVGGSIASQFIPSILRQFYAF